MCVPSTRHNAVCGGYPGMQSVLVQSSPLLMLDTAEYFEQRRELDKAVLLYQKAGKEQRALELCFSANLLDTLASIASNLTAKSDPAMMARCGNALQALPVSRTGNHSRQPDSQIRPCCDSTLY